jgi:hypothetical protein
MLEPPAPSWSQAGEDRIIFYLFSMSGSANELTYADLGAAFPTGHNNTYLFYTLGGSGLLVEADPSYLPFYRECRPRDRVEQVAVIPARIREGGHVDFHRMENPGWSTVSAEHVQIAATLQKGGVLEVLRVPCLTINELLQKHFPDGKIDILSIDLEGVDTELLSELDLSCFRPKVIVVENPQGWSNDLLAQSPEHSKLRSAGYGLFACTFVNYIYAHADILNKLCV